MLKGKTILLGVSGGIACYKAAALTSMLVKQHCNVEVLMTKNAAEFIAPQTFEALTGNRVMMDTFDRSHPYEVEHIALADRADLLLLAPATANLIAKCANGIADDMLTTTVLACDCPKLVAPAMNTRMYENPITQENISRLKGYGWKILEPVSGRLACGTVGKGKLLEPERLLEHVLHTIGYKKDFLGLRVLVTAGPTQESLDPVRFLTNHSSGKMGYAVARAAAQRGAEVCLVSGPVSLSPVPFVETVYIKTAEEMLKAVKEQSTDRDIIIMAAAVADYRPKQYSPQKLKKDNMDMLSIPVERTADILGWLSENRSEEQFICDFSMETEKLLENSRAKLSKKGLDMIAANCLTEEGAGFQSDTNILSLIEPDAETRLPLLSKDEAAHRLLDRILLSGKKFKNRDKI